MAAHEIKTTLAVDGEQAFKRSLNEARTSIKNLGSQLTLAQAEFKKDGDAMKLMETRAKALRGEIDQQAEIVRALEGALKEATDKYGEGSKEAEKWQAELNRANAAMANLENELSNNERGLDRNGNAFTSATEKAEDFTNAVNGIGRGVSFELITSGIGKITSGFETAIQKALELGVNMWNMMRDAASWADDEITLAQVYGVSTDDLQRMQFAAKAVDTDVDTVVKARQKLAQAMGKELNSKDIQEAFQALRVPVYDDATGKMRDLENVFWDAGAAIMNMEDEVEQNNAAMKLFGKSWMELKPLFTAGRQAYQDAMDKATIVPQENLEKLGALQNQLDALDQEFQALKMNVLSELAPAFEVLAGALTDLMAEFNSYLQTDEGKELMKSLNDAITAFFSSVADIDFQSAVGTVKDGLGNIKTAFDWIVNNKDGIETAIKAIGVAFAGLKAAELASSLMKVVFGWKLLKSTGGNNTTPTPTTTGNGTGGPVPVVTGGTQGGGFLVGLRNTMTRVNTWGAGVLAQAGNMAPVVGDVVLNQTNAGRALRDGGNVLEGLQQDVNEKVEEVQRNAQTFGQDWENNTLFKTLTWSGKNNIRYWQGIFDKLTEAQEYAEQMEEIEQQAVNTPTKSEPDENWVFGDDWSAGELMQWVQEHQNGGSLAPGGGLTDGVNGTLYAGTVGTAGGTGENNGLTSKDVQEFSKVPADIRREIKSAVLGWTVKIDGATAGAVIAPYIDAYMAREATD